MAIITNIDGKPIAFTTKPLNAGPINNFFMIKA